MVLPVDMANMVLASDGVAKEVIPQKRGVHVF